MAVRFFGTGVRAGGAVTENAEDAAGVQALIDDLPDLYTAALAVPAIDADLDSEAAVNAIKAKTDAIEAAMAATSYGSADVVRILIDTTSSPTIAQIEAALANVLRHIKQSNQFSAT